MILCHPAVGGIFGLHFKRRFAWWGGEHGQIGSFTSLANLFSFYVNQLIIASGQRLAVIQDNTFFKWNMLIYCYTAFGESLFACPKSNQKRQPKPIAPRVFGRPPHNGLYFWGLNAFGSQSFLLRVNLTHLVRVWKSNHVLCAETKGAELRTEGFGLFRFL
jgi:hypothetical protein